jgi:hypothetical protein
MYVKYTYLKQCVELRIVCGAVYFTQLFPFNTKSILKVTEKSYHCILMNYFNFFTIQNLLTCLVLPRCGDFTSSFLLFCVRIAEVRGVPQATR